MGKRNIVWNDYISQNERFADFINGVIFQGKQLVSPKSLKTLDTKLWRRKQEKNSYHEYIRDSVKLWEYKGKQYIFSLEPEESLHYALPVKYMNYESLEYDRQYKETLQNHRRDKDLSSDEYLSGFSLSDCLMPVITIGIYLGEKSWSGSAKLSEMSKMKEIPLEIKEQITSFYNEFQVNLLDIHALETSDIFQTDLREVFGFLKRRGNKEKLKQYVEENEAFCHMKEDAFDVLCTYSEGRKLVIRKENYRTRGGMDMCTAFREMIEEGCEMMNELNRKLVKDGRIEELIRSIQDAEYQKELLKEYGIKG